MKKLLCMIISVTMLLSMLTVNVFASKRIVSEEKMETNFSDMDVLYECSFQGVLDETYDKTWLDTMSEDGVLNMTLRAYWTGVTITFTHHGKESTYLKLPGGGSGFERPGSMDFNSNCNYVSNRAGEDYVLWYDDPRTTLKEQMHLDMYRTKGVNHISFYQYNGNSNNYIPEDAKTTIEVDNSTFTENAERSDGYDYTGLVFHLDGQRVDGSLGFSGSSSGDLSPHYQIDDTPDDTDDFWYDKERAVAKYGKYKDKDDVYHYVAKLMGTYDGEVLDYNVTAKAEFTKYFKNSSIIEDLSSTLEGEFTYYYLSKTSDGKPSPGTNTFLKVKGNKGERWFALTTINAQNSDSSFTVEGEKPKNDNSIYVGFMPIYEFDGKTYEHISSGEAIGMTFNYNNKTRSVLESVDVEIDGVTERVNFDEISFEGNFVSGFMEMAFPNASGEILKEMGL